MELSFGELDDDPPTTLRFGGLALTNASVPLPAVAPPLPLPALPRWRDSLSLQPASGHTVVQNDANATRHGPLATVPSGVGPMLTSNAAPAALSHGSSDEYLPSFATPSIDVSSRYNKESMRHVTFGANELLGHRPFVPDANSAIAPTRTPDSSETALMDALTPTQKQPLAGASGAAGSTNSRAVVTTLTPFDGTRAEAAKAIAPLASASSIAGAPASRSSPVDTAGVSDVLGYDDDENDDYDDDDDSVPFTTTPPVAMEPRTSTHGAVPAPTVTAVPFSLGVTTAAVPARDLHGAADALTDKKLSETPTRALLNPANDAAINATGITTTGSANVAALPLVVRQGLLSSSAVVDRVVETRNVGPLLDTLIPTLMQQDQPQLQAHDGLNTAYAPPVAAVVDAPSASLPVAEAQHSPPAMHRVNSPKVSIITTGAASTATTDGSTTRLGLGQKQTSTTLPAQSHPPQQRGVTAGALVRSPTTTVDAALSGTAKLMSPTNLGAASTAAHPPITVTTTTPSDSRGLVPMMVAPRATSLEARHAGLGGSVPPASARNASGSSQADDVEEAKPAARRSHRVSYPNHYNHVSTPLPRVPLDSADGSARDPTPSSWHRQQQLTTPHLVNSPDGSSPSSSAATGGGSSASHRSVKGVGAHVASGSRTTVSRSSRSSSSSATGVQQQARLPWPGSSSGAGSGHAANPHLISSPSHGRPLPAAPHLHLMTTHSASATISPARSSRVATPGSTSTATRASSVPLHVATPVVKDHSKPATRHSADAGVADAAEDPQTAAAAKEKYGRDDSIVAVQSVDGGGSQSGLQTFNVEEQDDENDDAGAVTSGNDSDTHPADWVESRKSHLRDVEGVISAPSSAATAAADDAAYAHAAPAGRIVPARSQSSLRGGGGQAAPSSSGAALRYATPSRPGRRAYLLRSAAGTATSATAAPSVEHGDGSAAGRDTPSKVRGGTSDVSPVVASTSPLQRGDVSSDTAQHPRVTAAQARVTTNWVSTEPASASRILRGRRHRDGDGSHAGIDVIDVRLAGGVWADVEATLFSPVVPAEGVARLSSVTGDAAAAAGDCAVDMAASGSHAEVTVGTSATAATDSTAPASEPEAAIVIAVPLQAPLPLLHSRIRSLSLLSCGLTCADVLLLPVMPRLVALDLSDNVLVGLGGSGRSDDDASFWLACAPALTELRMRGCGLEIVPPLIGAQRLAVLDLACNRIRSVAHLEATTTSLTTLDVSVNELASVNALRPLVSLTALTSLRLHPNPLTLLEAGTWRLRLLDLVPQIAELDGEPTPASRRRGSIASRAPPSPSTSKGGASLTPRRRVQAVVAAQEGSPTPLTDMTARHEQSTAPSPAVEHLTSPSSFHVSRSTPASHRPLRFASPVATAPAPADPLPLSRDRPRPSGIDAEEQRRRMAELAAPAARVRPPSPPPPPRQQQQRRQRAYPLARAPDTASAHDDGRATVASSVRSTLQGVTAHNFERMAEAAVGGQHQRQQKQRQSPQLPKRTPTRQRSVSRRKAVEHTTTGPRNSGAMDRLSVERLTYGNHSSDINAPADEETEEAHVYGNQTSDVNVPVDEEEARDDKAAEFGGRSTSPLSPSINDVLVTDEDAFDGIAAMEASDLAVLESAVQSGSAGNWIADANVRCVALLAALRHLLQATRVTGDDDFVEGSGLRELSDTASVWTAIAEQLRDVALLPASPLPGAARHSGVYSERHLEAALAAIEHTGAESSEVVRNLLAGVLAVADSTTRDAVVGIWRQLLAARAAVRAIGALIECAADKWVTDGDGMDSADGDTWARSNAMRLLAALLQSPVAEFTAALLQPPHA